MDDRYLYAGLIRLHVLHHAVKEPVYGLAMIEELGLHPHKVSAGNAVSHFAWARGERLPHLGRRTDGSAARRIYRATPAGVQALAAAKLKVRELFEERGEP